MKKITGLLLITVFTTACSDAANGPSSTKTLSAMHTDQDTTRQPPKPKPINPAGLKFVRMTEPVEQSYSIELPAGWKNDVTLVRVYEIVRPVTTSQSPDGQVLFFFGDGRMPGFSVPNEYLTETSFVANLNPLARVANYIPAGEFFMQYVREKFGTLPGFKITGKESSVPQLEKPIYEVLSRQGHQVSITSVCYKFQYLENNVPVYGLINGATIFGGTIWVAEVNGIISSEDPTRFNESLLKIAASSKTNDAWKQKEQMMHEQRMAKLRQDYQNQQIAFSAMNEAHQIRMQNIQQSSAAHQERIANLQSSFDSHNQSWANQQASIDRSHEKFVNVIRGEHTVADGNGNTYQVDNSHQKYFVNKHNKTYIGTQGTTSLDDLRKIRGVNPNDYEEVKIIR